MPPIHALDALHKDLEIQAKSRRSEPLLNPQDYESNFHAGLLPSRGLAYTLLVGAFALFALISWGLGYWS